MAPPNALHYVHPQFYVPRKWWSNVWSGGDRNYSTNINSSAVPMPYLQRSMKPTCWLWPLVWRLMSPLLTAIIMKALKCKTLGGNHIHHALSHIEQQVPRTFHTHNEIPIDRLCIYCACACECLARFVGPETARKRLTVSSNSFAYWLFHSISFERKVFRNSTEKSKKSLSDYPWVPLFAGFNGRWSS